MFNRKYIFKWWIFHCYVRLPEGTSLLLVLVLPPANPLPVTIPTFNDNNSTLKNRCWHVFSLDEALHWRLYDFGSAKHRVVTLLFGAWVVHPRTSLGRLVKFLGVGVDMGVSKNRGTPKWMVCNGKPYWNGWFGGTTIFGNIHIGKHSKKSIAVSIVPLIGGIGWGI